MKISTLLRLCLIITNFHLSITCVNAQVAIIDIGSAQQLNNPGNTFNAWRVSAISPTLGNAVCFANSNNNTQPVINPWTLFVLPVALNNPALVVQRYPSWANGTYLSCFQFNTIYNNNPTTSTFTNSQMTIRRFFRVCGNQNQSINFNLTIRSDDATGLIRVISDGQPPVNLYNPITPTQSLNNPVQITSSILLSPGLHSIEITTSNYDDINGTYHNIQGNQMQWNPFGISITGSISTINNSATLLNTLLDPSLPAITGENHVCVGDMLTLSNQTPNGTWVSSNPNVATINNSGGVTGITPGTTFISYQLGCLNSNLFQVDVIDCCEDSCNWSLTGNSNIQPWNFIGPKNNADFNIKTNNTQRIVVKATGNTGIGTTTPTKLLDVNGEVSIKNLPPKTANNRLVFANNDGDLKSLAPGQSNQYLNGNGIWQTFPIIPSQTYSADQGITITDDKIMLGDQCGSGSGVFYESREISLRDNNLYFNTETGKIFMGPTGHGTECLELKTKLEIDAGDLETDNGYTDLPSPSGLRFTRLTNNDVPVINKSEGVLSLDNNGDVIWVEKCCKDPELGQRIDALTNRLEEIEKSVSLVIVENEELKKYIQQLEVFLEEKQHVFLGQNSPNPFIENTTISFFIPEKSRIAKLIFSTADGKVVKSINIKTPGKSSIKVFANDLSKGLYFYTLVIDGTTIETKKMIKL